MSEAGKENAVSSTQTEFRRAYGIIGEVIVMANALDYQLNHICISVFSLERSVMLESVVASIDCARKIEMLKVYAAHLRPHDWKQGLRDHLKALERVNSARNQAAHSILTVENGEALLSSPAASKILRSLDLQTKSAKKIKLKVLDDAIKQGERALASGQNLLANFERLAAEKATRAASPQKGR